MTAEPIQLDTPDERRRTFVDSLYRRHAALSGNAHQAAEARQVLARLRRSLVGPQQQAQAYDVVFRHDPPEAEQEVWLLLAGLFALHPQPRPRGNNRGSLGFAMRSLAQRRGESVNRRFIQLLSVDRDALPHYLRQAVQLLHAENVALDYYRLLADLVVLLGARYREEDARRIRLGWARDFHRPPRTEQSSTTETKSAPTPTP